MTRRDILTAVPTSFHADGSLDLEGSRSIFRYVAQSGNEGAFVLGTTGEFPAIDDAEFAQLVEAALADLGDAMRVVVHVGAPSAFEAVRRVHRARELGATEFAAVTPYYLPASDDALLRYYDTLSDAVGEGSLYVYAYPARTGNPVSPELLGRLAERTNIVGVKASELSLEEIAAYRAAVPDEFVIYTGADRDLVAAGGVGAQGVVSGVSSVLPKPFRALAAAADSGDSDRVAAAQADVDDIVSVIGGDMPRMKAAYRAMGVADGHCRMALDEPSADALSEIDRVIAAHR
ncbi:dihydrodipicolinate synthase family protein [Microbacterium oryzae]|uniref:Dihydrodipicolinate synthase family protein n=1 Tax=Microbacterium oryzae TaxID=743009 RepID=A0A6I6DUW8_9MICO|nr:dihydrodipicolinate synthase family protein [Microbacterium oryzae]QGU27906.1 dihydrodipicolinate synthase family protein [Microbacterium oryzae]